MKKRGLNALHEAITTPLSTHLDAETIAELATAEAAGEDIEVSYPDQVRHIEVCAQCADEYGELVEMMLAAVGEAFAALSPQDVYVNTLLEDLGKQTVESPQLSVMVRKIVAHLPARLTDLAVNTETIEDLTEETDFSAAILRSIERHLPALTVYLTGMAEAAWGRAIGIKKSFSETWGALQLRPLPEATTPTLSGGETGKKWQIFRQHVGRPLPLNITAWAERESPLACSIFIQIDRPGLKEVDGRVVKLKYGDQTRTEETDHAGIVRFESVPVTVVPNIEILVQSS